MSDESKLYLLMPVYLLVFMLLLPLLIAVWVYNAIPNLIIKVRIK